MFKRHFIALAITISVYWIPPMLYNTHGYAEWLNSTAWSAIYCALIYRFAKIRIMPLLLGAEVMAMMSIVGAFVEVHILKLNGLFYVNYEQIINACYFAELIIIAVGVMNGGFVKRVHRFWLSIFDRGPHFRSNILSWEKSL